MLKSYPDKVIKSKDWDIYRDSENFYKLYIMVPEEVFKVAKKYVPSAISTKSPQYVQSCNKVKDSFIGISKRVATPDPW